MSGSPAPPLNLPDTSGEQHSIEPGAVTVVVWTCNHCPYALAWHDRLAEVASDYADRGVAMLFVNSNDGERYPADSIGAMHERVESEGWNVPYLWDADQEAARAWGAKTTPHVYVVDAAGNIAYEGAPDADHMDPTLRAAWLRDALDAALDGGQPPEDTEPIGCSVKWKV
jgi:hypothetical protein